MKTPFYQLVRKPFQKDMQHIVYHTELF